MGLFAIVWNVFIGIGTCVSLQQQGPPFAFLAVFWVGGFGLGYVWLHLRFARTIILLERDRIVVKKLLPWFEKVRERRLKADSEAELVLCFSEGDRPIYSVSVSTDEGAAKFGTALSDEEKEWLVWRIDTFLHHGVLNPLSAPPALNSSR